MLSAAFTPWQSSDIVAHRLVSSRGAIVFDAHRSRMPDRAYQCQRRLLAADLEQLAASVPRATQLDIVLSTGLDSIEEHNRVWAKLSADGTIRLVLRETFWGARFGMLVDQLAIPWMVNCEQAA